MEEIKELLAITQKLRDKYIHLNKEFSLDGKLVGDIGEVLAAEKYGLKLLDENAPIHDAEEIATGHMVQIKASFKGYFYFPHDFVPEIFLCVLIKHDGKLEEIYNGPGDYVLNEYINKNKIKAYKSSYYPLSMKKLLELNKKVVENMELKKLKSII